MALPATPLPADIVIRPMTSADVPRVRELHSTILPVAYPSSFFLQMLFLPGRICLVAHHRSNPNNPVGFVSASIQEPLCVYGAPRVNVPREVSPAPASALPGPQFKYVPGCDPQESRIEILTLGVLPPYQHNGLARHLVHRVIQTLRSPTKPTEEGNVVYAHVSTSNTSALKFYERLGMRVSSEVIRNLYRSCTSGSRDAYVVAGRVF
ncbi:hypothetical protein AX16_010591 [Volvariella volvacea WC 439]|nr:hypothetical protein AX16_010591 [Volvariella volvacea WC 439]